MEKNKKSEIKKEKTKEKKVEKKEKVIVKEEPEIKEEKIKEKKVEKKEEVIVKEEPEKQENKILKIIKLIFIIITSPIWFPWKVLFVRKKGRKFKDVSTPIKVFRVLHSPITLPLKFIIYLLVIGIEIFAIYKVRYSPVTYPITRASVHNYYLQKNNSKLLTDVSAAEINYHYDEFKQAFDYIDKWNLDSKNKIYVILDAKITKFTFDVLNNKMVTYVLNKFNSDETFREDVRIAIQNINKILNRTIKDIRSQAGGQEEVEMLLAPMSVAGGMLDYREALDIAWTGLNTVANTSIIDLNEIRIPEEAEMDTESLDMMFDVFIYYCKDHSLEETNNYMNEKYNIDSSINTENVITSNEIIMPE